MKKQIALSILLCSSIGLANEKISLSAAGKPIPFNEDCPELKPIRYAKSQIEFHKVSYSQPENGIVMVNDQIECEMESTVPVYEMPDGMKCHTISHSPVYCETTFSNQDKARASLITAMFLTKESKGYSSFLSTVTDTQADTRHSAFEVFDLGLRKVKTYVSSSRASTDPNILPDEIRASATIEDTP